MSQQALPATLHLGCGRDYRPDAHNVDCAGVVGPDEVVDLDAHPWPWPDNSFETVLARHVLEHLDAPLAALEEACRVLEPGGEVYLAYPIGTTRFEDPTHKHYWTVRTASAIAGERAHSHEHIPQLRLCDRAVDFSVSSRGWAAYANLRAAWTGVGDWLSQIPGLSGEVRAMYRYAPGPTREAT